MTRTLDRFSPQVLGARIHPYGASELKQLQSVYLRRALVLSCALAASIVALALWLAGTLENAPVVVPVVWKDATTFLPPPLTVPRMPQIAIAGGAQTAVRATPLPVPDIEAPAERTIPTRDEWQQFDPAPAGLGDRPVVVAPPEEPDPPREEWRHTEEIPVVIREVAPVYPPLAMQAGVEGRVTVAALVGVDGRVKSVVVEKSVPILDEAAVEAVRQWVFKPAVSGGRPVKAWVRVPVRFVLR